MSPQYCGAGAGERDARPRNETRYANGMMAAGSIAQAKFVGSSPVGERDINQPLISMTIGAWMT